MKKIFKSIGYSMLTLILLIGIYALAAFTLPKISVPKEDVTGNDVSIYILTNGIHADLVLPVQYDSIDWSKEIKFGHTISKDSLVKYVAIGWGDKGFYLETPTWDDLTFKVAFKAIFGLSSSAMHTTFYRRMKENGDCKRIDLSNEQYFRLVKYIRNSFQTDSNGHVINIQTNAHYDKRDAFYEAKRRYNLFYTCNTWTNNGLKSCGQKACLWTPFEKGIFKLYNK